MAARASEAEAEREAAIEEAAQAIFYLQRVRKELEALKRSDSDQQTSCHCNCASVERSSEGGRLEEPCTQQPANDGVNSTARNGQLLWQVGQIAETIWNTMHTTQRSGDGGKQSSITAPLVIQTLSDVKRAVLEQIQTLVPHDERHLYEELHALYAEVARHEKLQESMAQQIQALLNENDELEMRVQVLEERLLLDAKAEIAQYVPVSPLDQEAVTDISLKHTLNELQQQLDERESQIKQLLQMVEMQAAVISVEPVALQDSGGSNELQELHCSSELVSETHFYDEYDEFEAPVDDFLCRKPYSFEEVQDTFSGYESSQELTTDPVGRSSLQDSSQSESSDATGILQAQLEMYVRCFHRRGNKLKR